MKYQFEHKRDIFSCVRCPLYDAEYMICQHEDYVCKYISPRDILENRPSWCPLAEVDGINIVSVDVAKKDLPKPPIERFRGV